MEKKNDFFNLQLCGFSLEKPNLPENTIFYINQGYLSGKHSKKIYYNDVFIIGQISLKILMNTYQKKMK